MLLAEIHSQYHIKKQTNFFSIYKNKNISLQVQMRRQRMMVKCLSLLRAFCTTSCSGSFTVEAALVLPIMLFVLCGFVYFLVILNMQTALYEELLDNARKVSRYAFTYEEILHMSPSEEGEIKQSMEPELTDVLYHGFSSVYALEQIKSGVGREWLNQSCIRDGADGLSLLSDSLIDNNQMVDMVLRYRVSIPYLPGNVFDLLCVQRVRIRTFTGFMPADGEAGDGEETEEMVYVTETGTVYHTNKFCTHLNLSVRAVDSDNLATMRNNNGGKYYACELCPEKIGSPGTVYLTIHGDRYHSTLDCQGLKRSFQAIPISEVGDKKLCSRCQKQQ